MKSEPFIVAELSANHKQNIELAKKSVIAVSETGADAIKFQTYKPSCITIQSKKSLFKIDKGIWSGKYLWDLYENASMPWEWHEELFDIAKSLGLIAFSSPFSVEGVLFLENLGCPIYKIASFEISHTDLIIACAETKKPIIASCGVATEREIENMIDICNKYGTGDVTLLHCVSEYPGKVENANLGNIPRMANKWSGHNVKIGLSDHTPGHIVPVVATALGACVIEKHFVLSKEIQSIDSSFSLDKTEFKDMVNAVRDAKKSMSTKNNCECNVIKGKEFARSLFVVKDVKVGDKVHKGNIACIRPGHGLSPLNLELVYGREFNKDVEAGTPLSYDDLS